MTSLLEQYEQQYAVSTADFTAKIAKLNSATKFERRSLVGDLEKQIEELKELLEQMELEVREVDSSLRQKFRTRLDSYKAELTRLEHEFKIKNSTNFNDGYSSSEAFGEVSLKEEQKQRLLDTSEKIERSNTKLAASYSVLLETEEISHGVLRELQSQRETIQRSRARLRETDADLSKSSRLLHFMMARSRQHKIIIAAVGLIFLTLVILSLYYVIRRS